MSTVYNSYSSTTANINFENNVFNADVYVSYSYTSSNVLFRNCIFYDNLYTNSSNSNNTVVVNSIFSWTSTTTSSGQINAYNGTLFSHCLFFHDGGTRFVFQDNTNTTISNSIFYGTSPVPASSVGNVTFNNCFASQSHNDAFPTGNGNSVNGTITSITGNLFQDANIVLTNGWNINWNPSLDTSGAVELIGTGDDDTDIGLTGGTIPYSVTGAPLPYIKSLVVPSVIRQGDNMQVDIKANGN